MEDVATDCHLECAGQSLEDTFNLVMLVLPFGLDVEIHLGSIAEALEEVQEHLRRHLANLLTLEIGLPHQPGAPAKVETDAAEAVVHRQRITVALNAALVAQGAQQTFAKCQGGIFDGVMLVDVQVTLATNGQVNHSVLANLLEHVVEETQACLDVALAVAVEVNLHEDVGLLRSALYLGSALSAVGDGHCPLPALSSCAAGSTVNLQESAADVLRKLAVSVPVANHKAVGNVIVGIVDILLYESCIGLACRCIVLGEVGVDEDIVEDDALALQGVEDEVLDRPEGVLGKGVGSQSVLIADHDHFVVGMLAQEGKRADSTRYKLQFLEGINLLILGLADEGAVTIYKENSFHAS